MYDVALILSRSLFSHLNFIEINSNTFYLIVLFNVNVCINNTAVMKSVDLLEVFNTKYCDIHHPYKAVLIHPF